MAHAAIKTRFELDGEKEYKAAVSEINASLRVLNSEMKLISEQFKNNDKSVEALTASSDVLSRQILTQKEKIEALQAALKNSAERYGEADAVQNAGRPHSITHRRSREDGTRAEGKF